MKVHPEKTGVQGSAISLASHLPYQITLLAHRIARRTSAILGARTGLNLSQWRVLAAVAEAPGRTANEVVAVTPMDKGVVSRAVKSLLEMRLLARKASDEDGRLSLLFLTAKGRKTYGALAAEIRTIEDDLLGALSDDEARALRGLITRLCSIEI